MIHIAKDGFLMDISIYSVIMAVLWFSIFAIVFSHIMRKNQFIQSFNIWLLVLLAALCIARAVVAIELPWVKIIHSYTIFPAIREFLHYPLFADVNVLTIIVALWIIGSIFMLIRLLLNYVRIYRWLSTLSPTTNTTLLSIAKDICQTSKSVMVYQAAEIKSPMLTGFIKPIILLPDVDLPDAYIRNILLHEYSHFKHGDIWAKCLLNILCCFLWWHPFSYTLRSDLDHSLEIKCDSEVISNMTEDERIEYFEMIKNIASKTKRKSHSFTVGLVSAKHEKQLIQRFQLGLNYKKKNRHIANTIFCIVLIAVFVFSYAFIIQPASFPEEDAGIFDITPDNAYIVDNGDGTYELYVNNTYISNIGSVDIEPYSQLQIIER